MTPAFEIRLILNGPGASWEYVAYSRGQAIVASDGDDIFPTPGAALQACVAEVKARLPADRGAVDGR